MKPIFIVGFSGVGKTSIGSRLGKSLELSFFDTDALIEERLGMSITQLFEDEKGKTLFRNEEHLTLLSLLNKKKSIIATGGGTPLYHNNLELMQNAGIVIYFRATEEKLFERLWQVKASRPLIAHLNQTALKSYIHNTLQERRSYYEQAHHTIDLQEDYNDSEFQSLSEQIRGYVK